MPRDMPRLLGIGTEFYLFGGAGLISMLAFAASGVVASCAIAAIVTIKTAKATKRDWIMRLLFMIVPREKTESDCVAMLDGSRHALVTPRVPKTAGSAAICALSCVLSE